MKRARSALVVLVLAATAGVGLAQFSLNGFDPFKAAKDAGKIVKGTAGIGLKEESSIGGSVAIEIVAHFGGLWKDAAATRRVNLVGKSLARYCDRQELDFKFGLLNSDTVNAFSAPGGYVFITKGLYDLVGDNDDELAGVLGHEITHVTRRHALKIIERGELLSGVSDLAAMKSDDFAKYSEAVNSVTKTLFEKGFDPKTEYEADQGGRALAAVTGYTPGGLRATLLMLQANAAAGPKRAVFSTHPPLKERIKRLPAE
ncbi:MAG TPA: M48 family metalloprotease [Opitutaceae bacterium]|jgi:predicted Zn-dependent protease|nr:M48 family metalloprotease [Opitutaceae bacterium]